MFPKPPPNAQFQASAKARVAKVLAVGALLFPLVILAQKVEDFRRLPLADELAPKQVVPVRTQLREIPNPQLQITGSAATDTLTFVPITPCRLADTRQNSGYANLGQTPLVYLTPRTLSVWGTCGIGDSSFAEAYSLNVTVIPAHNTPGGYLLVYPDPVTPWPLASSFDWSPNAVYQSGSVVVPASSDGSVNFIVSNQTDVVVDLNGYYAPPTNSNSDTSVGLGSMASNSGGPYNTAFGAGSLQANTNGADNTAVGSASLYSTTGSDNTAIGYAALYSSNGNNNTAIGSSAGFSLSSGNDNIMIGNQGLSADDHTIRIGDLQNATYIAGIWGTQVSSGATIFINNKGQLGIQPSSRRYKEDIQDMGSASKDLFRLRPVTFRYKKSEPDGSKPLRYGLIAEEVAKVYPELVVRGKDGQAEGVEYSQLPVLLLNELQRQAHRAEEQDETIRKLEARLAALEKRIAAQTPSEPRR
jgi:hypothetical protein